MTPAEALDSAQLAQSSSSSSLHAAPPGPAPAPATSTPTTMTTPTALPPRATQLVQQNIEMLSLPVRDSPAYYDSTSSAASDSDVSDFAAEMERDDGDPLDHLAVPSPAHPVPTTNRGHKLSRLAPHTRRGRLGHYPNADAGFVQDAPGAAGGDLSAGAAWPAQKRRKLNDVAPYASEAGFPVAPNLHLVPRPVHTLSRESDHPATAYLPPVPQSPLDLLLMPSVQHTLGKKNQTFHLLGASATALIEQEAELINALAKVCRGLRGEGFEWRWQGDEGRRLAKQAAKDEEERKEVAKEAENAAAAAAAAAANQAIAATPAVTATPADTQATPAPPEAAAATLALETPSETSAATHAAIADLKEGGDDDVKLEQATPVLQSAVPPAPASTSTSTAEQQVAVPGISGAGQGDVAAAEEDTEMRSAEEGAAPEATLNNPPPVSDAPPAAAAANQTEPALGSSSAVTAAALAQGTDSGAGGSAPPPSAKEIAEGGGAAAEGARASAPPATTTTTTTPATKTGETEAAGGGGGGGGDVPAIAVTGPGATSAAAAAAAAAAPGESVEPTVGPGAGAGAGAGGATEAAEGDETATGGEATPAPSTAGGDESSAPAAAGGGGLSASNTATAAAARRRSGRGGGGGGGRGGGSVRHTRSRQSSPEDEGLYTSAGEDDPLFYDDEAAAAAAAGDSAAGGGGRRRGGGGGGSGSGTGVGAGARAQLVPEEELPEYAERMIDPEGYVRSLFVTEDKVELERLVPAPTGGMVGTGQFDSLTPNEQEVLLHDCMTDLHRFLADAVEYRNRLCEIRDGILGVERRRKGMWKVVRTVANDFLAEEEGAVYGQQQQQQQDGGAGYD